MGWGIAAAIGADILGGILGHDAQSSANRTNIRLQREQRDWEERMANSAYQRASQDMQKAGFNPMLAYSQGGANTPNVSAATVQPEDAISRSVSNAGGKAMQVQQLQNMELQNKILAQKAEQEAMLTERERVNMGRGEIRDPDTGEVTEAARPWFMDALKQKRSEAGIKELERQVAEQITGAQVSSARAQAQIKEQEVGLNEIRKILMNLDIPEKEALAKWFETVGAASPAAKAVMSIGNWLRLIFGR